MRKFIRTLLFLVGITGLVLTFQQTGETRIYRGENVTDVIPGRNEPWVSSNEVYRIGLEFSPWYESTFDASPICGVGSSRFNLASWSTVAFVVSLVCLWLSWRSLDKAKTQKHEPSEAGAPQADLRDPG